MLVLCIGVLAVGIYAIKPSTNLVTGTITINATNEPVTISVYKDSVATANLLDSKLSRAGVTLNVGTLSFDLDEANTLADVDPITLIVVFSTESTENLVIDTQTVESFDGVAEDDSVVKNMVSSTKFHSYTKTDDATGLACFSAGNDYQITITLKLAEFSMQKLDVTLNYNFDIYKASEYTGDGINGVDYLYFGTFPQSEATLTSGLTDTGEVYNSYENQGNKIFVDDSGNRYVQIVNAYETNYADDYHETTKTKYYLIEPLKWRILKQTDGTALLMCDTMVENVCYQSNYVQDGGNYYVKGEDGNPKPNPDTEATDDYIYANNYKYSDLREYLTNTFYNSAFSNLQKQLIQLTEVDNSAETTDSSTNEYACVNTEDYVFALSYVDLLTEDYGFSNVTSDLASRILYATNYAGSTGAVYYDVQYWIDYENDCCESYADTKEGALQHMIECDGYDEDVAETLINGDSGLWWLRSPDSDNSRIASYVFSDGIVHPGRHVYNDSFGAVPALCLSLEG